MTQRGTISEHRRENKRQVRRLERYPPFFVGPLRDPKRHRRARIQRGHDRLRMQYGAYLLHNIRQVRVMTYAQWLHSPERLDDAGRPVRPHRSA